ncbi:anti-sigma factor family protein [Streptomyces sp. NPDC001744]|uniref:anti-sigma factor family protein n=1 Tax=Streptomyces sp. NPDC001744 TaxID=3364606 RepID=UPI00367BDBAC
MSGTFPPSPPPSPAEQHLGDRLAALVDGELGHDARERVLAHLATCARCKAEADAQRTVKNLFASAAPPPPSEGFLARLQGLPGGSGEPGGGGPGDPGGFGRSKSPLEGLLGSGMTSDGFATAAVVTPHSGRPGHGFRIHEVGDRGSGRGRRFAFVAASAVSFAAIALGGTLPMDSSVSASGRGAQGTGSAVTPLRTTGGGAGGTGVPVTRGARSGERSGAQSVTAAPLAATTPTAFPHGPVTSAVLGTVPSGAVPPDAPRSFAAPTAAVRLSYPASPSLLALSPFVRPTPVLRSAFGPGAAAATGATTGPLGSPR